MVIKYIIKQVYLLSKRTSIIYVINLSIELSNTYQNYIKLKFQIKQTIALFIIK